MATSASAFTHVYAPAHTGYMSSLLERRLQLLIDEARFSQLEANARETGRSVSAVIRNAIDVYLQDGRPQMRAAVEGLLSASEAPESGSFEWSDEKAAIEASLLGRIQ